MVQSDTGHANHWDSIDYPDTVCSNAAVVFIQRCGKSSKMTLRMRLALADKGWTNTDLYIQFFKAPLVAGIDTSPRFFW
jgi:hypothetical protein